MNTPKDLQANLHRILDERRTAERGNFQVRLSESLADDVEAFRRLHSDRLGRSLSKAEAVEMLLSAALVLDRAASVVADAHDVPDTGVAGGLYAALRQFASTMPGTPSAAHLFDLARTVQRTGPVEAQVQGGAYAQLGTEVAERYGADGVTEAEQYANSNQPEEG